MISIVDDDRSFREATRRLIRSMGYRVSVFASAEEFLQSERVDDSSCLIVDMHMPGLSGLELQQHLIALDIRTPIIFVSALVRENAMAAVLAAGAVGFLSKPFIEQRLIDHIDTALKHDQRQSPG